MANNMKALLMQAAELRSAGCSWATIGKEVRRSAATVQGWPTRYVAHWRDFYDEACHGRQLEVRAEALRVMRGLLRGKDLKGQLKAGELLLKNCPHRISWDPFGDKGERDWELDSPPRWERFRELRKQLNEQHAQEGRPVPKYAEVLAMIRAEEAADREKARLARAEAEAKAQAEEELEQSNSDWRSLNVNTQTRRQQTMMNFGLMLVVCMSAINVVRIGGSGTGPVVRIHDTMPVPAIAPARLHFVNALPVAGGSSPRDGPFLEYPSTHREPRHGLIDTCQCARYDAGELLFPTRRGVSDASFHCTDSHRLCSARCARGQG